MKKFSHLLMKYSILAMFFILPLTLKANTLDDLKNQFITLGGSPEGFNEIIKVVQQAQSSSTQLKDKINKEYNKLMFNAMVASNFDSKEYMQVYNNLEQEKNHLANQNLNSMIVLLQKLSLKDRQAYAQLLYGVDNNLPLPSVPEVAPGSNTSDNNVKSQ